MVKHYIINLNILKFYELEFLVLDVYPRETLACGFPQICTKIFIAALFKTEKKMLNNPNAIDKRMSKLIFIHSNNRALNRSENN